MKKALIIGLAVLVAWNFQLFTGAKESLIELFIVGKLPGTEVYLSFSTTMLILGFFIYLLIRWAKELTIDYIEFNLEQAKLQEISNDVIEVDPIPVSPAPYPRNLSEEELDLLSV